MDKPVKSDDLEIKNMTIVTKQLIYTLNMTVADQLLIYIRNKNSRTNCYDIK